MSERNDKSVILDVISEGFQFVVPCFTYIDEPEIRDHLQRDRFFWLDLVDPGREGLDRLHDLFGFHPLALEDTEQFDQRPEARRLRRSHLSRLLRGLA